MTKIKTGGVAADQLRSIVERIEKLTEERDAIAADIRDVMAEAVGNGWDRKGIQQILKLRKMDAHERDEQSHIVDLYARAIGLLPELDDESEGA